MEFILEKYGAIEEKYVFHGRPIIYIIYEYMQVINAEEHIFFELQSLAIIYLQLNLVIVDFVNTFQPYC